VVPETAADRISGRHVRRLRDRYDSGEAEGLIDRRRGRAAMDRIEFVVESIVVEHYRTRYWHFTKTLLPTSVTL
jgi:hypothetical protein